MLLSPMFLLGQDYTDSSYYEVVAINDTIDYYYINSIRDFDNGNYEYKRELIGDSIQFVNYLYKQVRKAQTEKGNNTRKAYLNKNLGDEARLLSDFTGFNYYVHGSFRMANAFMGSCTVRVSGIPYEAEVIMPNNLLKIDISGFDIYTLRPIARNLIELVNFQGENVELFLLNPGDDRKVFVNFDNTIRIIFNQ